MYKDFLGRDLVVGDIIAYFAAARHNQGTLQLARVTKLNTMQQQGWHDGLPPAGSPQYVLNTVQPGPNGQPRWYGTGPSPALQVQRFDEYNGRWSFHGKHNLPNMDKTIKVDPATLPADIQTFLKNNP